MLREEINTIEASPKKVREGSLAVACVLALIGSFIWWKTSTAPTNLFVFCGILALLGLVVPKLMKYVFIGWMIFALLIGYVVSRILLTVLYYFCVTPIACLTRIQGKKFLDLNFRSDNKESYWISRTDEMPVKERMEKQY